VGFEPTVTTSATTVFETAPFGHSGTSPDAGIIPDNPLEFDDLVPLGIFHLVHPAALKFLLENARHFRLAVH
jgi:hypothetical protein